jgi:hypothetical protein
MHKGKYRRKSWWWSKIAPLAPQPPEGGVKNLTMVFSRLSRCKHPCQRKKKRVGTCVQSWCSRGATLRFLKTDFFYLKEAFLSCQCLFYDWQGASILANVKKGICLTSKVFFSVGSPQNKKA